MQNPILLAQKLISFPSVTPIDAGIIDFIIEYLTPFGFTCKKLVFENVTNLYARYGKEEPNFCFAGHTDVVPPGENWSSDPFKAIIKDGKLYGRGASDMKSALAAAFAAAIDFIKNNKFKGSISFLITGDEEGPAKNGTIKVLEYLNSKKEILSACIVGEPTCSEQFGDIIKYGRRGSVSFHLTVIGKQGHVAYPDLAVNPIDILVKIISALKAYKLDSGNEDFDPSNLEFTNLNVGNLAGNIIPGEAEVEFNIRFNNFYDTQKLKALVNEICSRYSNNYLLKTMPSAEAFVNPKNSKVITCLKQSIEEIIKTSPILSTTGGTSDARFIRNFCQIAEFGLINKTAHHVDEHVLCQDIEDLKETYLRFLQHYFNESEG